MWLKNRFVLVKITCKLKAHDVEIWRIIFFKVSRIVSLFISILTLCQLIAGLNLGLLDTFRVDLMVFECVSPKSNY